MSESSVSYYYQVMTQQVEIVSADGAPASAEQLYVALHDQDPEVCVSAALGLARLGDLSPQVTDALFIAADWRSDPEASVSARAGIVELAQTNPAISDLMLIALKEDKGRLSGVAECLGEIGQATPAVISGLLYFSRRSADPYAVISAVHSLLTLGYQDEVINTQLVRQYYRGDELVQGVALRAMGLVAQPSPEMLRLLQAVLQKGDQYAGYAIHALTQAGWPNDQLEAQLIQASQANRWELRDAAITGLGVLTNPSPAVVDVLCNALGDPNWFVRRSALVSLSNVGRAAPKVIDRLLALLATEEAKAQGSVASTTKGADWAAEPEIDTIVSILDDNQNLSVDIALTLAQLGCHHDRVIATFLAALCDSDASVRERIARNWWLLGKDNPTALAALQTALHDPVTMVRTSATNSWHRLPREDSADEQ